MKIIQLEGNKTWLGHKINLVKYGNHMFSYVKRKSRYKA